MDVLGYVALFFVPALAFLAGERVLTVFSTWSGRRAPAARTADERAGELDRLRQDLRRLGREHGRLMNSDVPAKVARLHAVELAYDDTLALACRVLEVELDVSPIRAAARAQMEADLMLRGFVW